MTDLEYLAQLLAAFHAAEKALQSANSCEETPPWVWAPLWQAHEDAGKLFVAVSHLYRNRGPVENGSGLQAAWFTRQA